jgi:hypothetical protein
MRSPVRRSLRTRSDSRPGSQLDPAVEAPLRAPAPLETRLPIDAALGPRLAGDELAHAFAVEAPATVDSVALAVEPLDRSSLPLHLVTERAAVAGAAEDAELVEPSLGLVQLVCCLPAFLVQRRPVLEELAVLVGEPDVLGERSTASRGVEGERLGSGAAQCLG